MEHVPLTEDQKINQCSKCGESVITIKSKTGREYLATVQQDVTGLVVISKNGVVMEHNHAGAY